MAIIVNGTTVSRVFVNGTEITGDVTVNGTVVFTGQQAQTDDPTIVYVRENKSSITLKFQNNDASSATIYADIEPTNPPTTNRGVVASNDDTGNVTFSGLQSQTTYTFYCSAQASGESMSNVVSAQFTTD